MSSPPSPLPPPAAWAGRAGHPRQGWGQAAAVERVCAAAALSVFRVLRQSPAPAAPMRAGPARRTLSVGTAAAGI